MTPMDYSQRKSVTTVKLIAEKVEQHNDRGSALVQEWCGRATGFLSSKTLSAEMMGNTLFRWKLIKWLTLSKVRSFVRTCRETTITILTNCSNSCQQDLLRLPDRPGASACDGRIAFQSGRTGLGNPVTREPENRHPIGQKER